MLIQIKNTKEISEDQFVVAIVEKVQADPIIFPFLARIFSTYKNNNASLREEAFSYIDREFNSPRLRRVLNSVIIEQLKEDLKEIYVLSTDKYSKVRGEILENVVYHLGPVTPGFTRDLVFVEPILEETNYIIGESENKCDVVFYEDESSPMEFIECKSSIENIVPRNLPFEKVKKSHQNKIIYLDKIYKYLRANYCEPKIYLACYNSNYRLELHNIQNNWGFVYMDFVNAEEIISGKMT